MDPAGEGPAGAEEEGLMSTWDPFDRPRPTLDCLLHEAVLVQAWKKSHDHIRSRNWYADVLELDYSAALLPEQIRAWSKGGAKPVELRVVPAPKTKRWEFTGDKSGPQWRPSTTEKDGSKAKPFRLRPLAHMPIREQTLFTALMICFADLVEGAQGDTELSVEDARKRGVVSYGNRLLCDYALDGGDGARFRWGNAATYRQYFIDYQRFLERPKEFCRTLNQDRLVRPSGGGLAVVSLDLDGFFDQIRIDDLIDRLSKRCQEQGGSVKDEFWQQARGVMDWEFAAKDRRSLGRRDVFKDEKLKLGLPQGGVASGFFSNVAMLEFDKAMSNAIGGEAKVGRHIRVLDYVRYVDDLRLVVQYDDVDGAKDSRNQLERCVKEVEQWVGKKLGQQTAGQTLNTSKTDYVLSSDLETQGSDAKVMRSIQSVISGPMDTPAMADVSLLLQGLLNSIDDVQASAGELETKSSLDLEIIHRRVREVRDDSIVRFVAYRQAKLLRARRELAGEGGLEDAGQVEAEIESASKRLVHHWSHDPSLTLVLRAALDLTPQLSLLEPVIEAMRPYLTSKGTGPKAACLAVLYGVSDLLASLTTHRYQTDESFAAEPGSAAFLDCLGDLAAELIGRSQMPWYVKQQAAMAALSLGRVQEVLDALPLDGLEPELKLYRRLALVMVGRFKDAAEGDLDSPGWLGLAAVAAQLDGGGRFVAKLKRFVEKMPTEQCARTTRRLAQMIPGEEWLCVLPPTVDVAKREAKGWRSLVEVIRGVENPFADEAAVLRLAEAILNAKLFRASLGESLAIERVWVQYDDLRRLAKPVRGADRIKIEVDLERGDALEDAHPYALPDWAAGTRGWLMAVGMVMRAAFIGDEDYTARWTGEVPPAVGYRGLRSTWFKRRHGMFQRSDGLGGPGAGCSSWLSDLLAHLLAWPGAVERHCDEFGIAQITRPEDLVAVIAQRFKRLDELYASNSKMPVYEHSVGQELIDGDKLTVALVQTVRPWREDFNLYGSELSDPRYRGRRRDHLAAMLRLTLDHVQVRPTYETRPKDGTKTKPKVHLTVLPEFSVHRDDLDLVERYVDKTGSLVFCGLTFHQHPDGSGDLVNTGRWVIRDQGATGRSLRHIMQGKQNMTEIEGGRGIVGYRPHQVVLTVRGQSPPVETYRLSGALCYDATDLALATDLRGVTDMLLVPANNKDVNTFDDLAASLSYLMFQHVAIVNTGEYGGTVIRAPYKNSFERVLTEVHGGGHASVAVVDVSLSDYRKTRKPRAMKGKPAAFRDRKS